jgi:pyrimidine operon attenuation protein/uracil phosphoribosyltransferase
MGEGVFFGALMADTGQNTPPATVIMSSEAVAESVRQMAREIIEAHEGGDFVLLGILRRGRPLADRLADTIEAMSGVRPPVGSIATTLYRDDIRAGRAPRSVPSGNTHFDFDVNGAEVVLVDDVLYSGRTVRAALDEIMDYGRPARIQFACLIDRGLRELPIQADYLGKAIGTGPGDHVSVRLAEMDGEDMVLLEPGEPDPREEE